MCVIFKKYIKDVPNHSRLNPPGLFSFSPKYIFHWPPLDWNRNAAVKMCTSRLLPNNTSSVSATFAGVGF